MMRKLFTATLLFIVSFLPLKLLAAEKVVKRPEPPKSAALLVRQADIDALIQYEKKLEEIRDILQTDTKFTDSKLRFYRRQIEAIYMDLGNRSSKYKSRIDAARSLMKNTANTAEEDKATNGAEFKVEYDPYYLEKIREFKQEIAFYEGRLLQIRLLEFESLAVLRNINRIRNQVNHSGLWDTASPFYKPASWEMATTQIVSFTKTLFNQLAQVGARVAQNEQWGRFWSSILICLAVFIIYFYWAMRVVERINKKEFNPDDKMRRCSLFVLDILMRGFLPALFVIFVFRYFIGWMDINTFPLSLNFVRSIGNAIGFVLATGAFVYTSCRYFRYRGTDLLGRLATPLLILMYQFAAIVFINNIDIFSVYAKSYPFYPNQATDLVNLVIAVSLAIYLFWLASRVKRIAGVV